MGARRVLPQLHHAAFYYGLLLISVVPVICFLSFEVQPADGRKKSASPTAPCEEGGNIRSMCLHALPCEERGEKGGGGGGERPGLPYCKETDRRNAS